MECFFPVSDSENADPISGLRVEPCVQAVLRKSRRSVFSKCKRLKIFGSAIVESLLCSQQSVNMKRDSGDFGSSIVDVNSHATQIIPMICSRKDPSQRANMSW